MFGFGQKRLNRKLLRAAANGHAREAARLIELGASIDTQQGQKYYGDATPLGAAIASSQDAVVRLLLGQGADPDIVDGAGETALGRALHASEWDIAREIHGAGGTLGANRGGYTSALNNGLLGAAAAGKVRDIEFMLTLGADIEARGGAAFQRNATPLGIAAGKGHQRAVQFLLDRGANANLADGDGQTALGRALQAGQLEIARDIHRAQSKLGLKRETPTATLNSGLLTAAADGNLRDMEFMLDLGADIEARGGAKVHWNGTALSIAAYKGHLGAVQFLLGRGADVNAADGDGDTVLNAAAMHEQPEVVEELLRRGADPARRSKRGENAADIARKKMQPRMCELLGIQTAPEVAAQPPDEVTFRRALGARVLEETFNFAARERISLVLKGEEGPVEAMTRDSFDDLGDRATLRRAYDEYVKKGGTIPESAVFPESLGKLKPKL